MRFIIYAIAIYKHIGIMIITPINSLTIPIMKKTPPPEKMLLKNRFLTPPKKLATAPLMNPSTWFIEHTTIDAIGPNSSVSANTDDIVP
jgi:hypothetical protein